MRIRRPEKSEAGAPLSFREALVSAVLLASFSAIAVQLLLLGLKGQQEVRLARAEPIAMSWSRPDIVDRRGALLATDVIGHSLYADPALVLDRDELVEKVGQVLPAIDRGRLLVDLADRSRRFLWIQRGLTPREAQRIHDLGIPALGFRRELKRAYPAGPLVSRIIGATDPDNRAVSGLEVFIDESGLASPSLDARRSQREPVRLSLDLGIQHGVASELQNAIDHYRAKAAAGLVMEVRSGEILAAVSLEQAPRRNPGDVAAVSAKDLLGDATYELGSIFKIFTVAMALDQGRATPTRQLDIASPIEVDGHTIRDAHAGLGRLSVADVLIRSSNVGSGRLALEAGAQAQRAFLESIGLLESVPLESGTTAPPQIPRRWADIETVTISYGHGLAVAPLHVATATAAMVNGGWRVRPTLLQSPPGNPSQRSRVISVQTSETMRSLLRQVVVDLHGTGRAADVSGLGVAGKTGTAELAAKGGYKEKSVISSFVAAFPYDAPRYLTLVMLFEPHGSGMGRGGISAGVTAAPVTAKVIRRIAPLLSTFPGGGAPIR